MVRASIEDLTIDNEILIMAFDEARRLHQNIEDYIEHSLMIRWVIEEYGYDEMFDGFDFYKPSKNYIEDNEEEEG